MNASNEKLPKTIRHEAKKLLKAVLSGNLEAMKFVAEFHPQVESYINLETWRLWQTKRPLKLADIQLVLARKRGYKSWPEMKRTFLETGNY